jgi:putative sigma-54 modulation protein
MNMHIRGENHLDITPALRQYLEKKLGRVERYLEQPDEAELTVTMSVVRDVHTIEVMIPFSHVMLRAEERSNDMYASIDLVIDKLEKRLDKFKHKIDQKGAHKGKGDNGRVKDLAKASYEDLSEQVEHVVRVKEFEMKPMAVDEAILQMDMLGHDFFVFSNAESEEVNVVYRRRDGQYGLIQAR